MITKLLHAYSVLSSHQETGFRDHGDQRPFRAFGRKCLAFPE